MKYLFLGLLLFSSFSNWGQDSYAEYLNQKLYQKLPDKCRKDFKTLDTVICKIKSKNFTLYKTTYSDGLESFSVKIFHKIFDSTKIEVFRFIEREVLYNLLLTPKEKNDRMIIKKIKISSDNERKITPIFLNRFINNFSGYSIKIENLLYNIKLLSNTDEHLYISFPAKYSVIKERDKVGLQLLLENDLINRKNDNLIHYNKYSKDELKPYNDIFIRKGAFFGINDMNSNVFYKADKSGIVFDKKHLKESFSNLFLTNISNNKKFMVSLKMNNYKGIDTINISLQQLLSYFGKEYMKFFGVEKVNENNIRGTLILYNKALSYMHLMDVVITKDDLFNEGQIDVNMHSYIPTDNIKELFGIMK